MHKVENIFVMASILSFSDTAPLLP